MKKPFQNVNEKWKEYALAGCVTVTLLVALLNLEIILTWIGNALKVFSPVLLGVVIAYMLNPLAVFFSKKLFSKIRNRKISWNLSVLLSVALVLGFFVLVFSMLIPQVADNVQYFLDNVDVYLDGLIEKYADHPLFSGLIADNVNEYLLGDNGVVGKAATFLANNVKTLISTASSVGGRAANVAVGAVLSLYFLLAKDGICRTIVRLLELILSPVKYVRCRILFEKFDAIFSKYIICELLDSLLVGGLNFIFMVICGMPSAVFLSVIVAVTNLAPTFGPIVGAVLAAFILLLSAPGKVLLFLIFTLALQTADAYVVKPRLFGGALNVPGVLILLFIIVCGKLMGIAGMLLAIPIAAIVVYLYSEVLIPYMELKRDVKEYKKEQKKNEQQS